MARRVHPVEGAQPRTGKRILLPSPEDAAAYHYTDDDRADIAARAGSVLVGGPATVVGRLQAVLDETGADELMVTTPVFHHADRRRSYELVASVAERLRPGARRGSGLVG
ncbi:hypothetical protein ACFQYP_58505 [Nonomuraea antimicrobica]